MKKIKAKDIRPGDTFLWRGRVVKATHVGTVFAPGFPRNARGQRTQIRIEGGQPAYFNPNTTTHLIEEV